MCLLFFGGLIALGMLAVYVVYPLVALLLFAKSIWWVLIAIGVIVIGLFINEFFGGDKIE